MKKDHKVCIVIYQKNTFNRMDKYYYKKGNIKHENQN